MGRATWGPEEAAWLLEHRHGLPPASPYRPAYVYPSTKKDTGRPALDPWLTQEFKARHVGMGRGELALRWLDETFGQGCPACRRDRDCTCLHYCLECGCVTNHTTEQHRESACE